MAKGLFYDSLAWRLEVTVLTQKYKKSPTTEIEPRLMLVHRADTDDPLEVEILGYVTGGVSISRSRKEPWLVYHYPPGGGDLGNHSSQDATGFHHILDEGEARDPRPTAKAAVERLLALVATNVAKDDLAPLSAVANILLPTFEKATSTFAAKRAQTPPSKQ